MAKATAERNRRPSDDQFFVPGCKIALYDTLTFIYIEEKTTDCYDDDENDYDLSTEENVVYRCSMPGCEATFDTLSACDKHYQESHVFECSECKAVFPNNHLLDLHLQETHDSYFATALERSKASYQCLVSSCHEVFRTDNERCMHLRSKHGYPKWFRFHPRSKEHIAVKKKEDDKNATEKKKLKWMEKRNVKSDNFALLEHDLKIDEVEKENFVFSPQHRSHTDGIKVYGKIQNKCSNSNEASTNNEMKISDETIQAGETPMDLPDERSKLENKKLERRERQKKKRATIPCRFFASKGGCWRGEKCMFLHDLSCNFEYSSNNRRDDEQHNNGWNQKADENKMDTDPLINDLANCMERKARVTVPDKIVFGKRRSRQGRIMRK
mmetsp:Transcript_24554/g.36026  ORF Transcript_24554/g.36026 Transcript_24554/m.36026 type:complete len:383 (+) Transcript_24554:35-1183(+)